jgi:DNA-binding SARP family transcriptional activator
MDPRSIAFLIEALMALGTTRRSTVESLTERVAGPGAFDHLIAVPGIERHGDLVTVDEGKLAPGHRSTRSDGPSPDALGLAVDACLLEGDLAEAGRFAIEARSAPHLRQVVERALRTTPPLVGTRELRRWRDEGSLPLADPHRRWLDAAIGAAAGAPPAEILAEYRAISAVFEASGEVRSEISVGLAAAAVARRTDDLGTLLAFLQRATEAAAAGIDEARAPMLLGQALTQQILGDSSGALATVDAIPANALGGDWAAQVELVRGTNLALLGRMHEAISAYESAAHHGGTWTYATALDLISAARWRAGDPVGAIADAEAAEESAALSGDRHLIALVRSGRAAMLAAFGAVDEAQALAGSVDPGSAGDEPARLLAAAEVLAATSGNDLDRARALAASLAPPPRALRSAHWAAALVWALVPDVPAAWTALAEAQPALGAAVDAGRAAAAHLAGGPPAPAEARAFLPAIWCAGAPVTVEVRPVGEPEVRRDRLPVTHPAWRRSRVRELCLHLVLVEDAGRDVIVRRLWPDLEPRAGARNLRVTLSHLADVLDPDRRKGTGSDLVEDRSGALRLRPDVRVDLQLAMQATRRLLHACAADDRKLALGLARRLLRFSGGAVLGGAATTDGWADPYLDLRRNLLVRAATEGGLLLAAHGHADTAEQLARLGLGEDPWAERLHQVLVRSLLAQDDLDAARAALRRTHEMLAELTVRPEAATVALGRLIGMGEAG